MLNLSDLKIVQQSELWVLTDACAVGGLKASETAASSFSNDLTIQIDLLSRRSLCIQSKVQREVTTYNDALWEGHFMAS